MVSLGSYVTSCWLEALPPSNQPKRKESPRLKFLKFFRKTRENELQRGQMCSRASPDPQDDPFHHDPLPTENIWDIWFLRNCCCPLVEKVIKYRRRRYQESERKQSRFNLNVQQVFKCQIYDANNHVSLIDNNGGFSNISTISEAYGWATSQINHAVRQVILCKDFDGKVGLRVRSVNKGIFVCLVAKGSPAAMAGLRFGDQILQINSENVAGYSESKVNDTIRRAGVNNIVMAVRDRPFERTLTLHKDNAGRLGFQFKDGKITAIAVNSSSAKNGMLIEHNLLEVNGQNVIGVKDKDIAKIIDEGGPAVTVTVIPSYLFVNMIRNMSTSLVKKMMDHSIPDM